MADIRRQRPYVLGCVLAGIVAAAGQAPVSIWWLALAGFAALIWLIGQAGSRRQAALLGWAAGLGYVGATHFWIVEPFFVDPWRHGWMAPFAVVGIACGIALIWAVGAFFGYVSGAGRAMRLLGLVPALGLAEMARAYLFTGFPWAPIGSFWLGTPVDQLAAISGVHGLSALSLLALALPASAFAFGRMAGLAGLGVSLALIGGAWAWGQTVLNTTVPARDVVVRVVQPNAPQNLKWDPEYIPVFLSRALKLTADRAAPAPDLVVWPETSVPTLLHYADAVLPRMSSDAGNVPVIFGVQRQIGREYRNSLAVLDATGAVSNIYDKRHLVPFGEYVPYGNTLGRLGIGHMANAQGYGYAPGAPDQPLLDLGPLGKGLPLICYEGIFPQDLLGFAGRADWIVLITNDAWFGKLSMPYQHFDHARMRSIETGLPMIRAANTGISGIIDARGRVVDRLALGEAGYVDAALPGAAPVTVYAQAGDGPLFVVLALWWLLQSGLARALVARRRPNTD